jgi:hypothetical protein
MDKTPREIALENGNGANTIGKNSGGKASKVHVFQRPGFNLLKHIIIPSKM